MYHDITIKELYHKLDTNSEGLTSHTAQKRLERFGRNEIKAQKRLSVIKLFLSQFKSPLIWILIGAVIVSFSLGEGLDGFVILIILILNAILGFVQEFKAEKAIDALKKMANPEAVVLRDKKEIGIDSAELVPGDIILIQTGDRIPVDARLIESINLETEEASLTGESAPVKKSTEMLPRTTPVADRINMAYMGTVVTRGRGKAVVTETGMNTEIGKIADMIQREEKEETPLQHQIKHLSKMLGILVLAICVMVFAAGVLKKEASVIDMFLAAVALAVAAIPEGLPAVVTISLALGIRRMIKRNALIRKLPSVETLGCTTVICTDKTGTLTKNEMTVKKLYANNEIINVTGAGYDKKGEFSLNPKKFELLLDIGALCSDAKIDNRVIGDPTEAALIVSAAKAGIIKEDLEFKYPRVEEIPFDSERKMMTTAHRVKNSRLAFTKGAPDIVIRQCDRIYEGGKVRQITREDRKRILDVNESFAREALRVLAFAYREAEGKLTEKNLVFVGLQAMIDPPRDEVKTSIEKCKKAGINVVMITGDHRETAVAIANSIGLSGKAITGLELDKMSEQELKNAVDEIKIYARVNPAHKLRIIKALQSKQNVVAMTGDGVNDAPALKKADIGISMGIKGVDVAKEASDMILTDDNFSSIVNAIEEGRTVYDNIRKFIQYLLSSNMGEVMTVFLAILAGLPLPLVAVQLLWINLVTDGLPALALGVDPPTPRLMEQSPRKKRTYIVNMDRAAMMFLIGVIMMLGTLGTFKYYLTTYGLAYARTMAFTTLMMFQMFNVFNTRLEWGSAFKSGKNKWLFGAVILSILLQVLIVQTPLSRYFSAMPLATLDWIYVFVVSSTVLIFVEIIKIFQKAFYKAAK